MRLFGLPSVSSVVVAMTNSIKLNREAGRPGVPSEIFAVGSPNPENSATNLWPGVPVPILFGDGNSVDSRGRDVTDSIFSQKLHAPPRMRAGRL